MINQWENMSQILMSQNKPKCESHECLEWHQLSARQPVSQSPISLSTFNTVLILSHPGTCGPTHYMCMYLSLCIDIYEHTLTRTSVSMSPCIASCVNVNFCIYKVHPCVYLPLWHSDLWGVCELFCVQWRRGEWQFMSPLFTKQSGRSKAKNKDHCLVLLTRGCLEHDKSIHTP